MFITKRESVYIYIVFRKRNLMREWPLLSLYFMDDDVYIHHFCVYIYIYNFKRIVDMME
jgi:hypothetical protein